MVFLITTSYNEIQFTLWLSLGLIDSERTAVLDYWQELSTKLKTQLQDVQPRGIVDQSLNLRLGHQPPAEESPSLPTRRMTSLWIQRPDHRKYDGRGQVAAAC